MIGHLVLWAVLAVGRAQFIVERPTRLYWDLADSIANVQTYSTTLKVDSQAAQPITPACVSVNNGASTTCNYQTTVRMNASHTFVVTVTLGTSASGSFTYHP